MKYLIRLFLIVFFISTLSYLYFTPKQENNREQDVALTINGRQFLKEKINDEQSKYGYHTDELTSVYNSIITEEVLIEEAQHLGIDKEEEFRLALKKYYEQSLVKILLERKTKEIQVTITDKDIDNYTSKIGSTITFTRIENSSSGDTDSNTSTVLFDDLAQTLKIIISPLHPGEQADSFDTGNGKFTIRLDTITPATTPSSKDYNRMEIKEILREAMVQQKINRWLSELIGKADITIHKNTPQQ